MAKPCTPHPIAQREQLFKLQSANVGVKGQCPCVLLGDQKGAILSRERMAPFFSCSAIGAAFYAVQQNCTGSVAALSHSSSSPLRYGEIAAKTLA